MKIGYVRVSTQEQNTIRQEVMMEELGVPASFARRQYVHERAAHSSLMPKVGVGVDPETMDIAKYELYFIRFPQTFRNFFHEISDFRIFQPCICKNKGQRIRAAVTKSNYCRDNFNIRTLEDVMVDQINSFMDTIEGAMTDAVPQFHRPRSKHEQGRGFFGVREILSLMTLTIDNRAFYGIQYYMYLSRLNLAQMKGARL